MYNKRRITQKILAAVMSVVMLLGPLSVSAFAAGAENEVQPGAPMQLQNLENGMAMWAGEKLAGGVVSSIAGYPVNQAMGKIFGTQTDEVLQALEAIKAQIGQLRDDINALSKKVDKVQLQGVLNDYGDFIDRYSSVYNELINAQKINDPAASKLLLTKIFEGKDANYMVGGDSLKNATINFGIRIRSVKATESGSCNIFGAIDIYDRYVNVWEHQGYAMRQNFRDKQLALYTLFSSMSQLACQTIIDSNQGSTAEAILAKHEAVSRLKDLMDDAALMNEMVNRTAMIRHPNLRIARDIKQGQDLCAFYPDINVAYVVKDREGDAPLWADFSQSVDRYASVDYLASMTNDKTVKRTAWSAGWEFYTNQPTPDEYAKLLADYGGTPSLYNIFFDADKGNFNNIGGRQDKLAFLCNHYVVRGRDYDRVTWESNNHIENNGEVEGWWTFSKARFDSKYTGRPRDTWFDNTNAFIVNKYQGEVKQGSLQGPAPSSMDDNAGGAISGMEPSYALPYNDPVTLDIDQNDGSYQWSVNKNDGDGFTQLEGETNKTYTLPALTAEMLGWQYSCTTTIDPTPPDAEPEYIYSKPVTLDLTGDGIPGLMLVHDVGTAPELKAALDKVDFDEWNGHTLRLTADITYPNPIALDGRHNLTLDLNGYTLTVQPGSDAQPNVNAMSSKPQIAAICLNEDHLSIRDSSEGSGTLKIVAGPGIDYGIYAANASGFDGYDLVTDDTVNVASTGGTAILAADDSLVAVKGSVRAEGECAYGVACLNSGSSVIVAKDVTVSGKSACGVYVASFDGGSSTQIVRILSGSLTVSGENSRAALMDANAEFSVGGSVTVTGGAEGISVNKGYAEITGDVTAPDYAINARSNNARVVVGGNVSVTRENAVAVSSVGAEISVGGNVTSADSGGVGILAATWISPDDVFEHGGLVTVEGNISAVTPLLIESTPVTDESESAEFDSPYHVFAVPARGTSKVKAMPGSLEVKAVSLVTFDKNGGDTKASPAAKEVISGGSAGALPTAPTRSGYTFDGWNTQADGGGTAFTAATPVTGPITVYAQWHRTNSDGDGGNPATPPAKTPQTETKITGNTATATTTTTATVDNNGKATAAVTSKQVSDAIRQALAEAQKQGSGTAAVVAIKVEAPADAAAVETSIPKEAMVLAADGKTAALTVSTPVAAITFDAGALSTIAGAASADVKISVSKVEASGLSAEVQQAVGDRPVFNFSVTSGDTAISKFGGSVSAAVPYTPKAGEALNAIVIYRINAEGMPEVVSNCSFDPATGTISFKTSHFSKYAVGYNKVTFKDVTESAWYGKAVGFIAARGITTGTGNGNYSPDAKLTRGEFLVMMMRTCGMVPDTDLINNFADTGNTYYTGYLAAAKRLSISEGIGNNMFAPGKEITRQEMFTLLYNALKALNELPQGSTGKMLSDFTDSGEIAIWAKEAMSMLVKSGTVSGDGGRLDPTGGSTRAQMAQVLYKLLAQ